MNNERIEIDLDKISEIALKGVRRAAVFIGLGVNAANDPDFKNYQLSKIEKLKMRHLHIELLPAQVDDDTISAFKEEFGAWIVRNGLRELIETYAVFLDGIYQSSLWVDRIQKNADGEQLQNLYRSFHFKGVEDKLSSLAEGYDIKPDHPEHIVSIHKARNCLTHRRGIVAFEDCNDGQQLTVKWMGFDIFAESPAGERKSLNVIPPEGIRGFDTDADIKLQVVERSKSFVLGSVVTFESHELSEICNSIRLSIPPIIGSVVRYAESLGLTVRRKEAN